MQPKHELLHLIDDLPQIIFETDHAGRWTFLNRAWEVVIGSSVEDTLGRSFPEFIHREDEAKAITLFQFLQEEPQETVNAELRFRIKDGGFCWFNVFARARLNHAGNFAGTYGTFTDITERRRVDEELRMHREKLERLVEMRTDELRAANRDLHQEVSRRQRIAEKLRESEGLFRGSFENSPLGMALTEPSGRILEVNGSLVRLLGYTRQELLAHTLQEITHPVDQDQSAGHLHDLLTGEQERFAEERRFLRKNGTIVNVQLHVSALRNEQGEVDMFITQVQDITERKAAERALASRLRFEGALASASQSLLRRQEGAVAEALRELREATAVDRAYLFENSWDEDGVLYGRQRAKATAPGVPSQTDDLKFQAMPYESAGLGRWRQLLAEGNVIAGRVDRFPKIERDVLEARGIRSILVLPLTVDGNWSGFVAFDDLEQARDWDEENVRLLQTAVDMIANYIAHQRLERRIRGSLAYRGRQVALSAQLAEDIARATDTDHLYAQVVERVNEAFDYYHTQLFRFHPLDEALILVAGSGEPGEKFLSQGQRIPLGVGVIGTVAATEQSILRPDVRQDPEWQPNPILPDTRGELAVPVRLGDELLGVLDVQSEGVGTLDEEDQLLLEGLAGQIAMAIESMRLRQQTEDRLQELGNLQRLMSREAWLKYQSSRSRDGAGYLYDRHGVKKVTGKLLQPPAGSNGDSKRAVVRPLTVRGERFGVMGVKHDPDNPLLPEDHELLDAISVQVAEALESARLLEQTQKRAVELETVSRVSVATSTILETENLLDAVVELTKRSFNLYHAHIYLLNHESGELELVAGSGNAGDTMVKRGWSIPVYHEKSVVARVARTREGIIVNDVHADPNVLPNPLLPATRAELAVPMVVGRRLLGVLDVQSDEVNRFSDEDVRIQSALASQIAIALQNATLYQEQLQTAERLREFDRLKSEFLASMSHELRTPLNSIIGFADVLLEGIDGELNARMEEDVRLIRDSGDHLRNLIGDILDMSKIEAGMMDLHYESIDLLALEKELEAFARSQMMAHDKSLDFNVELGPGVSEIRVDRTRFKQVLFNLLSNAVKFTAEGAIQVQIAVADEMLQVSVSDTGIGIAEEDIPHVFEQFRQVDSSLTGTVGGTGLGLPISKSLVELHGGTIMVESMVGEGTDFTFTIPLARPEELGRKSPHEVEPLAEVN